MIQTFNKRKWKIQLTGPIDGLCDVPGSRRLTLIICADLKTQGGLETAIHEALHAEDSRMKEDKVERISKEIADFLWKLGYRYNGS